jgi:hypothetical protein
MWLQQSLQPAFFTIPKFAIERGQARGGVRQRGDLLERPEWLVSNIDFYELV